MLIVPATTGADVALAAHVFDDQLQPDAVERFTSDPGHHLLLAIDADAVAGFVSGVEMTPGQGD
jgi:hypothetical protein